MMPFFWLYKNTMSLAKPVIHRVAQRRIKHGKEDPIRIHERFGRASLARPDGPLLWVHVASVGEAQSLMVLIHHFLAQNPQAHVLVTSITTTSANLLQNRLPPRAFHQYLPIDRPQWVRRFLSHWKPQMVLWAESELWPVILHEIRRANTPSALINARMSPKSFRNWMHIRKSAESLLETFTLVLTQTDTDAKNFRKLGARSVTCTGNIKFAADPLPCDLTDLNALRTAIGNRPLWVYASTHEGEEDLALRVHAHIAPAIPNLLTIIIPRHPHRRDAVCAACIERGMDITLRGQEKTLPSQTTQIYVVDTIGELGLFYRITPLACIGRSFSDDGGGGHNPLEAAQLHCAVIHGPHVQNLQDIYTLMDSQKAARMVPDPRDLAATVQEILTDSATCRMMQESAFTFAQGQMDILNAVIEELEPVFMWANLPVMKQIKAGVS